MLVSDTPDCRDGFELRPAEQEARRPDVRAGDHGRLARAS